MTAILMDEGGAAATGGRVIVIPIAYEPPERRTALLSCELKFRTWRAAAEWAEREGVTISNRDGVQLELEEEARRAAA